MIPILLDKTKTLSSLVSSKTGGIGDITGAFEGKAVEEANGLKEISFKLPITSSRYSDLTVGSYIKVKDSEDHDPQIYEVYKITKPLNGIVTVKAEHISYILGKASVTPFTATGVIPTTQNMISHLVGTFPFTFETDIVNSTSNFTLDVPMSFRKALGGWRGSVLDVFGGELDWDNLEVKLLAHRGADRGVRVEYGKNLTSLTQEESIANVYDAVLGYATYNEQTYVGTVQKITTTDSPRTLNIDFSSAFEYDEEPTQERLNYLALTYAQNNDIGKPTVNLKVSFEPLSKTEEYKDIAILEQTNLFDVVYILFPKLGVESKAKIIRTEYDFINEKMISIELGDAKTNLLGLVDEQVESQISNIDVDTAQIENAIGFLDTYVDNLSQIISNSLGLFFTAVKKLDGSYQYYLHDEPELSDSMNQWTINAGGFALSTDGGQTWSAGIDAEGNAVLNSLSTVVLRALQIYGSFLRFGDVSSNYIDVAPYSSGNVPQGVSFDGSGYVRFQPQGKFLVNNINVNSQTLNEFVLGTSNSVAQITLKNYDYSNRQLANAIEMDSNLTDSNQVKYNQLHLTNYLTSTGTSYLQNDITLSSKTSFNAIKLDNYQLNGSTYLANRIYLYENTSEDILYLRNYKRNQNNLVANTVSLQSGTQNILDIRNYNMNKDNYANQIRLLTSSSGNGNSLYINNNNTDGNSVNSIQMTESGTLYLTCSADLRIQSSGAVRIMANYNSSTSDQDVLIQGKTIKLIREGNGLFSLYTGGSESGARYNIEVPSISVGQTGYLSVYRAN